MSSSTHLRDASTREGAGHPKGEFLPKIRIEPDRKDRYHRAYMAWKEATGVSDTPFASWVRNALDERASEDLGDE
jgi:hypothetical protein